MNFKLKSRSLGARGEEVACAYLAERGYKIIGRNVYYRVSEIDIIAEKNKTTVFVEVKARVGNTLPAEAVTKSKRQKLFSAMMRYLQQHPRADYRLDVIAINFLPDGQSKIEHYENVGPND